jgi:hypothetical protein
MLSGMALLLAGCSAATNAHFGIRPDPPPFVSGETPCAQYEDLVNYSLALQEAYHSRATQNRAWIYVAGALAIGTAAAVGGLGAAGAATLTLTLLSISGGAASSFFAVIDNATLADIYTISANQVASGVDRSRQQLFVDEATTEASCQTALNTLLHDVTEAENLLERARTDSAVAAGIRAQAQIEELRKIIATPTTAPPVATPPTP